ncbi:hypothetical protein AeRB84_005694 [Aphanomyces euteiches]|nr:hypothetical protein AeRB84_005694 [Aphanomyces euteiches]
MDNTKHPIAAGKDLLAAAQNGDLNSVRDLLTRGADANFNDERDESPLHWASGKGYLDIVKELLLHGASVDAQSQSGSAGLHFAASSGHLDVVAELLARVNLPNLTDQTALHNATSEQHLKIVNRLLDDGASVDFQDSYGVAPIHIAVRKGDEDILKELLDRGASVDLPDNSGNTPIYSATRRGDLKILNVLLNCGANVDATNKDGTCPLHLAAAQDDMKIVMTLLNAGANRLLKDKEGKTAHDLGNISMQLLLKNYRPDTSNEIDMTIATENTQHPEINTTGIYSMQSAVEVIQQARQNIREISSEILTTGSAILSLASAVPIQRRIVLTIGLTIERVIRHAQLGGLLDQAPGLLSVMKDIKEYLETHAIEIPIWKLQLDYATQIANIKIVGEQLERLLARLQDAVKNVAIDVRLQVVGDIDDISRKMIEKLCISDRCLGRILNEPNLQQMISLLDLAIQVQRGLEYYKRQFILGKKKMSCLLDFERQVESCQKQIEQKVTEITSVKKQNQKLKLIDLSFIQPWMLSRDDLQFNPNDTSTLLGKGGSASVFKGKYHGQDVAIKQFNTIKVIDLEDSKDLFAREIKAWKDISHERYILTLIGAICTRVERPILVCELCQTNIRRYVRDRPETCIPMVYQFAKGLVSLHKANIIHRDLKGDNVLVSYNGTVAIADFRLSRTISSLENTKTGTARSGTLYWMSPEQYLKPRQVTTKSDVWSFGMTLWEIRCNDTPFRICSEDEFRTEIFQREDDRPPKPPSLQQEHEPLWTLITKCWRLEPTTRPSATEIVDFLESHYSSQLTAYSLGCLSL